MMREEHPPSPTQQQNVAPDLLSGDTSAPPQQSQSNYVAMEMGSENKDVPAVVDDDDDNDVRSKAPSVISSVLTADGIHDPIGFVCVCFVILLGDMSRGVMFPTMWPLVESLGGTHVMLGYSVAAFSFGRVLVNPVFGNMSHTHGYTKTLLLSTSLLMVGTILYAQVQTVNLTEFLIVAQTCLGVGSGTLGVTRAFVADVTAKRNRTTFMAWITAVQYAGFTVTPFIGSFFIWYLGDDDYYLGPIRINKFTTPAYFMTLISAMTVLILAVYFQGRQRITIKKDARKSSAQTARDEYASATTWIGLTVYDCCILGCFLLNVSTKGSIASFETMGIAIAQTHFDMTSSRAGMIVSCSGAFGVFCLLSMRSLERRFSDIQLITGGMAVMGVGIAVLIPIQNEVEAPSWQFMLAIFLIYGVGYPIGHTAVIGIFSKIVGRRPQGLLLGWFASAGSLARMAFPVMSGYISSYAGMDKLFFTLCLVLVASIMFVHLARHTLDFLSS